MKKVLMGCTFALASLFATDSMAMPPQSCKYIWAKYCTRSGDGPSCVKREVADCVAEFNKRVPYNRSPMKVCDKDCLEACDKFALKKGGPANKIKGDIAKCMLNAGPQGL